MNLFIYLDFIYNEYNVQRVCMLIDVNDTNIYI